MTSSKLLASYGTLPLTWSIVVVAHDPAIGKLDPLWLMPLSLWLCTHMSGCYWCCLSALGSSHRVLHTVVLLGSRGTAQTDEGLNIACAPMLNLNGPLCLYFDPLTSRVWAQNILPPFGWGFLIAIQQHWSSDLANPEEPLLRARR